MSVISNRHTVVPFVSGESKAFQDQRLAKITYKPRNNKPAKFPSVCVSVPQINPTDIESNIKRVIPHVLTMLENAQDGVIRSMYESSEGQLKEVSDSDISFDSILAFMEAEATGSRLTADKIKEWFRSEIADNLTVMIAEKLGFEEMNDSQLETIGKHLNAYADIFASLNGKMVFLDQNKIAKLQAAMNLAKDDEHEVHVKLAAKLEAMAAKPLEELL